MFAGRWPLVIDYTDLPYLGFILGSVLARWVRELYVFLIGGLVSLPLPFLMRDG